MECVSKVKQDTVICIRYKVTVLLWSLEGRAYFPGGK